YTPGSIKNFVDRVGIAKRENVIDMGLLEFMIREDLNKKAPRYMAVLNPLKIVLNDYPEELTEYMDIENNPEDEKAGSRKVPFSKEIYIERDDFMEDPPKKFFRLAPGKEVRLKGAYIIKCEEVIKDEEGNVTELHCSYDPDSKSGMEGSKRKVKGTLHWVAAGQAIDVEVRLYDRLFNVEDPNKVPEGGTFLDNLNPDSLKILQAKVEPALDDIKTEAKVQFQRLGYFYLDYKYTTKKKKVFNRTVTLKDTWAKIASKK
ncbi:MAG: glutamine--tRNA ligase, partial [Bacteroidota bacterium]